MAKVQQISEITPSFAFTKFDFYKNHEESFKKCEIGRIHALLLLHEMAVRFGLIDAHSRKKAGRKPYFSPEGKVQEALAEAWKPYMNNLDTLYTDATCYESAMR